MKDIIPLYNISHNKNCACESCTGAFTSDIDSTPHHIALSNLTNWIICQLEEIKNIIKKNVARRKCTQSLDYIDRCIIDLITCKRSCLEIDDMISELECLGMSGDFIDDTYFRINVFIKMHNKWLGKYLRTEFKKEDKRRQEKINAT